MARKKILVVEDDAAIREGIIDALKYEGYDQLEAARGDLALRVACEVEFDLLLLDLILPLVDGLQILQEVRKSKPLLPVIILTARGQEADRVRGLRLGADDYVVKPFSARELLARIEALLRRTPERPLSISKIVLPDGTLDLNRREVRFDDGRHAELSEREVDLIRYLASNNGRAVAREEILTHVWGMDPKGVSTRTIDMHIARLREKIEIEPSTPQVILTVRGKGYKFSPSSR